MVGFRPGHAFVNAIYTAARSEDELFNAAVSGEVEHVLGSLHVGFEIFVRFQN